jgi:hypothetical protein
MKVLALIAPSWTRKSSTLASLGLPDRPTIGSYRLNAVDALALRGSKLNRVRRELIGYLFQNFILKPCKTALENVPVTPVRLAHRPLQPVVRSPEPTLEAPPAEVIVDGLPRGYSRGSMRYEQPHLRRQDTSLASCRWATLGRLAAPFGPTEQRFKDGPLFVGKVGWVA